MKTEAASDEHDHEQPRDLTHFVVITHGRTGSTLLSNALRVHPAVRMYGELYHEDRVERGRTLRPGEAVYEAGEDAARYLRETVFRDRWWAELRAVGFKFFYDHARRDAQVARAWRALAEDPDVRIVHLSRRNLLDAWVSYLVAERTGEWARPAGVSAPAEPRPLLVDPARCFRFFDDILRMRESVRSTFDAHPILELEYERDIARDFHSGNRRVQEFLGLPYRASEPSLQKQARRPTRDQVENFDELRERARAGPYAEFFGAEEPEFTGRRQSSPRSSR